MCTIISFLHPHTEEVEVVSLPTVAVKVRVCDLAVSKSSAVAVVEIAPVLELTANKPPSLPAVML